MITLLRASFAHQALTAAGLVAGSSALERRAQPIKIVE